jgi:hypothetical protein
MPSGHLHCTTSDEHVIQFEHRATPGRKDSSISPYLDYFLIKAALRHACDANGGLEPCPAMCVASGSAALCLMIMQASTLPTEASTDTVNVKPARPQSRCADVACVHV